MKNTTSTAAVQIPAELIEGEWLSFPGGELEGKRPKALCAACREQLNRVAAGAGHAATNRVRPLCFQCYRAELERERAFGAAAALDTASTARFQSGLPFEPVDKARLQMLKVERLDARATMATGADRYAFNVRQAQIAARHALARAALSSAAIHAAELQLPESWLPFVVAR
jgi:hypothetical protein